MIQLEKQLIRRILNFPTGIDRVRLVGLVTLWALPAMLLSPSALGQTAVELRVADETAPPGGTALLFVGLTEPEPISGGQTRIRYRGSRTAAAAVTASSGASLGEVTAIDLLSLRDQVSGTVAVANGTVTIQLEAMAGLFGTDPDLPLIALAVPVSPAAVPGESFSVEIELALLTGPGGTSYVVGTKPGTFTVGGTSINEISPRRGILPPGSSVRVLGVGFEPGAQVRIEGADVDFVEFVSSTEMQVHLESGLELRNTTRFRLRNPSGAEDSFYPINQRPELPPSAGTISFLSAPAQVLAGLEDALELQTDLQTGGTLALQVSDPEVLTVVADELNLPPGPHRHSIRVLGKAAGQAVLTARVNGLETEVSLTVAKGSVFQIPVLSNRADLRLGLALTSQSASPADVTILGFPAGSGDAQQPIEVQLQLEPRAQISLFLDELSPEFAEFTGWVQVVSADPRIFALFIHLPETVIRYPGAAGIDRGQETFALTFPRAGNYEIALVNNSLEEAQIQFNWYSRGGDPLAAASRVIPSRGSLIARVEDLSMPPDVLLDQVYLRVQSSQALVGYLEMTDLPEIFGSGLAGNSEPEAPVDLPRFASGDGWSTVVDVVNLSDSPCTGRILARTESGLALPEEVVELSGRGLTRIDFSTLPGLDPARIEAGSARFELGCRASLSALLSGPEGSGVATSVPVLQGSSEEYVFGQVATGRHSGIHLFTGLGLLNSGPEVSEVVAQIFNTNGLLIGEAAFSLPGGASRVALLSELVPLLRSQLGGHVHLVASRPILAVEIFGDYALSFLSAVPASVVDPR